MEAREKGAGDNEMKRKKTKKCLLDQRRAVVNGKRTRRTNDFLNSIKYRTHIEMARMSENSQRQRIRKAERKRTKKKRRKKEEDANADDKEKENKQENT